MGSLGRREKLPTCFRSEGRRSPGAPSSVTFHSFYIFSGWAALAQLLNTKLPQGSLVEEPHPHSTVPGTPSAPHLHSSSSGSCRYVTALLRYQVAFNTSPPSQPPVRGLGGARHRPAAAAQARPPTCLCLRSWPLLRPHATGSHTWALTSVLEGPCAIRTSLLFLI